MTHAQRVRDMLDAAAGLDGRIAEAWVVLSRLHLRASYYAGQQLSDAAPGLWSRLQEAQSSLHMLRAWRLILRLRQRCRRLAQERDVQHAYAVAFSEQCVRFSRHHQQQRERIAELERERDEARQHAAMACEQEPCGACAGCALAAEVYGS